MQWVDAEDTTAAAAVAAAAGTPPAQNTGKTLTYADYASGTPIKLGSHVALKLDEVNAGDLAAIKAKFASVNNRFL